MSHSTVSSTGESETDTSDRELETRVREAITNHGRHSLNHVSIRVDEGVVTLYGTVKSFYERQLCIRACQQLGDIRQLIDKIEVVK